MSAYMKSKQNFKYDQISTYIIPVVIEREVGLDNLEAEFCKPILLEEITAPVYIYDAGLPCKPCRVMINTVLLHNRMLTKNQTEQIVSGLKWTVFRQLTV